MIPEIGHFALIIAWSLAACLGVLPLIGAARDNAVLSGSARPLAHGQFVFLAIAFGCLTYAFVVNDFSVLYVAQHSNSQPPPRRSRPPPAAGGVRPLVRRPPGLLPPPPMLYMGYVGFSVAFAFDIAALLSGKMDVAWARWSRPWTTVAWAFLTLGIMLGAWWAYRELGWGGWGVRGPTENASFM